MTSRRGHESGPEKREDEVDTVRLPALRRLAVPAELSAEAPELAGGDPYSKAVPQRKAPRRTLDDMRRLSEQIKRAAGSTGPRKPAR